MKMPFSQLCTVLEETWSTFHNVIDILCNCYDNIEIFRVGLLDSAKAFDTVDHYTLLQKLHHYGLRGIVNNSFKSFLKDRSQFAFFSMLYKYCGSPRIYVWSISILVVY